MVRLAPFIASIRAFGFTNPILADLQGNLIAGHGRLRAAKEMGLDSVPVITLVGLSEAQKKALRLADNKIALNAGWDTEILKLELAELSLPEIDIDLGLTGFSPGEIDVVLAESEDPDDEVIPAVPTNPRVQPGDIWQLGEHRVACGDGRDLAFLRRLLGEGERIDCAFLDPPYNVKINGHANAKGRHREFAMASGEMIDDQFRAFLTHTLGACAKVSRNGAVHFVCMDWRHMDDITASVTGIYDDLLNICVWNKSNAGMGSLYRSKHEMVFVYPSTQASPSASLTSVAFLPTIAASSTSQSRPSGSESGTGTGLPSTTSSADQRANRLGKDGVGRSDSAPCLT